jgi:hypothetical protein
VEKRSGSGHGDDQLGAELVKFHSSASGALPNFGDLIEETALTVPPDRDLEYPIRAASSSVTTSPAP